LTYITLYPPPHMTHACILLPSTLTYITLYPPPHMTHACILLPSTLTYITRIHDQLRGEGERVGQRGEVRAGKG